MFNKSHEKSDIVFDRARSVRGQLLTASAIQLAIDVMEQIPSPYQQIGDISDLKDFRTYIWDHPNEVLIKTAYPEGWNKKIDYPETFLTKNPVYGNKEE